MATSGTEQGNRLMEVVATEGRELEEDFRRIETETRPEERRRIWRKPSSCVGEPPSRGLAPRDLARSAPVNRTSADNLRFPSRFGSSSYP